MSCSIGLSLILIIMAYQFHHNFWDRCCERSSCGWWITRNILPLPFPYRSDFFFVQHTGSVGFLIRSAWVSSIQDCSNSVEQGSSSSAGCSESNSQEIPPVVRMFNSIWINRVRSVIVFSVLQFWLHACNAWLKNLSKWPCCQQCETGATPSAHPHRTPAASQSVRELSEYTLRNIRTSTRDNHSQNSVLVLLHSRFGIRISSTWRFIPGHIMTQDVFFLDDSEMEFQCQNLRYQESVQYEISPLVQSLFLREMLQVLWILGLPGVMCILGTRVWSLHTIIHVRRGLGLNTNCHLGPGSC